MVKTLLKMVLGILLLAAVFFAGLQLWEKFRAKPQIPVTPTPEAAKVPAIHDITVIPSGDGAVIQISEIGGPHYKVTAVEQPRGFVVELPSAQVALASNVLARPHSLVALIEAIPIFAQGVSSAKIRVELAPGTMFKDRLVGGTLFFDVARTALAVATSTPIPRGKVAPSPQRVEKRISAPPPKPKRREVAKAPKKPAKPTKIERKPKPEVIPRRLPTPVPPTVEDESLMQELGLEEPSVALPTPEPEAPTPPPKIVEETKPAQAPAPEEEEPLDLDQLFKEEPKVAERPPEEPAPPPQIAMAPPSAEKFDAAKIAKELPAIRNLSVFTEGGVTTIQIQRDAKTMYQVFRMVNPPRVIIDFKDSTNGLQREYPGFQGTRVQRATTQQFTGPEGTISRVTLYIQGKTNYKQDVKGTTFILRLP